MADLTGEITGEITISSTVEGEVSVGSTVEGEVSVGSTQDYNELFNQPSINDVVLIGNKTLEDLSIQEKGEYVDNDNTMTNLEILAIINGGI